MWQGEKSIPLTVTIATSHFKSNKEEKISFSLKNIIPQHYI